MKIDILMVSRVTRILKLVGIENIPDLQENPSAISMLAMLSTEQIDSICSVIGCENEDKNSTIRIGKFFEQFSLETKQYQDEIEKRIEHCIALGVYKRDTEQELLKKQEEAKNLYFSDFYLSVFTMLSKNGIEPLKLTLYEALIVFEDISCTDIISSCSELLSMLESEKGTKTFCSSIKDILKFVNFHAFALDIFNDIEKMYKETKKKD